MEAHDRYRGWSASQLIARIQELEAKAPLSNGKQPSSDAFAASNSTDIAGESSTRSPAAKSKKEKKREAKAGGHRASQNASDQSDPSSSSANRKSKERRPFIVSDLPMRKIALRFAYDGLHYSGLAAQGDGVPDSKGTLAAAASSQPTVEALLWNALVMARLVDPEKGMSGAGWSRCGRTDKGVSAAGQVVALWVRSRKVDERDLRRAEDERLEQRMASGKMKYERMQEDGADEAEAEEGEDGEDVIAGVQAEHKAAEKNRDDASTLLPGISPDEPELSYVASLNRLLPESIRVLGWSPVRASFNARFDCRYRHYKYFFTSGPPEHLIPPLGHPARKSAAPRMDIEAMRKGASYLLGEHDFRNLCRVDASKQIKNFRRRIDGVSIDRVESGWPATSGGERSLDEKRRNGVSSSSSSSSPITVEDGHEDMYVLNLRGTAFLYHQVRHIMAILLLIGARLEPPSIVKELLNIRPGAWAEDSEWLNKTGAKLGATALPGSTATELDGFTAASSSPQLKAQMQAPVEVNVDDDEGANHAAVATKENERELTVYERKPEYELSADRPLVLWECGFRPKDIQWRAGAWDGKLPPPSSPLSDPLDGEGDKKQQPANGTMPIHKDLISSSTTVVNELYKTWVKSAISTEVTRHFLLAASAPASAPNSSNCGTLYRDARWPSFVMPDEESKTLALSGAYRGKTAIEDDPYVTLPFGNGEHRVVGVWKGLAGRKREDTPEVKNERWLSGKGQRRADRKAAEQQSVSQSEQTGAERLS
ncbi:unnamed protein product [Jaminaea pallidilutea]